MLFQCFSERLLCSADLRDGMTTQVVYLFYYEECLCITIESGKNKHEECNGYMMPYSYS